MRVVLLKLLVVFLLAMWMSTVLLLEKSTCKLLMGATHSRFQPRASHNGKVLVCYVGTF